jgi:hypothetical protein
MILLFGVEEEYQIHQHLKHQAVAVAADEAETYQPLQQAQAELLAQVEQVVQEVIPPPTLHLEAMVVTEILAAAAAAQAEVMKAAEAALEERVVQVLFIFIIKEVKWA